MPAFAPVAGLTVRAATTYAALSAQAADIICEELKRKPDLLLCLSAGATPTGLYQELVERQKRTPKLFAGFRALGVDEWGGLPRGSAGTCQADLEEKLLGPVGVKRRRRWLFQSDARPARAECERMARWLARNGPIDICILGLGLNGHIAMNEPASVLVPGVHVSRLASSSMNHPMLKGQSHKPRYGLTLGLGDILRSRRILLLVSGETKRGVLKKLLRPQVATQFPASFLWLHPNATVLCDRAALGTNRF
jgi:galactosamine-6-phosphate isomerase